MKKLKTTIKGIFAYLILIAAVLVIATAVTGNFAYSCGLLIPFVLICPLSYLIGRSKGAMVVTIISCYLSPTKFSSIIFKKKMSLNLRL